MTFIWLDALWLLVALPGLIGIYMALLRRRTTAVQYSSLSLMREAMTAASRFRRHVPASLLMLALVASVIAIARPALDVTLPARQRTIILAIDVSLSMAAQDVAPTRLAAAQAAAKAFIENQPRDVRIGIIAFAGDADLVQPPTRNRRDAIAAIDQLQLQYNTAIGSGIIAALITIFPEAGIGAEFDIFGMGRSPVTVQPIAVSNVRIQKTRFQPVPPGSFPSAAIILLTDGRDTLGVTPSRAAQMAAERGIRIYTVGFGKTEQTHLEIDGHTLDVSFDEATLKEVATITDGEYFHAATAQELKNVYQNLRGRVVLQRNEIEISALFTALAAILLLLAATLSVIRSNPLERQRI